MVNELIEALANGPLVPTRDKYECAFCRNASDKEVNDFVHTVNCPVNQARLLIACMEKNMTEVIG